MGLQWALDGAWRTSVSPVGLPLMPFPVTASRGLFFRPCAAGLAAFLAAAVLVTSSCNRQPRIRIVIQQTSPPLEMIAREAAARLEQSGYLVAVSAGAEASAGRSDALILNVGSPSLKPDSFEIVPMRADGFLLVRVTGADLRSTLWAALEAADQITAGNGVDVVQPVQESALLPVRASRITLSLDKLSPELWRPYFDLLAHNRFNSVFVQVTSGLARFSPIGGGTAEAGASATELKVNIERVHRVLQITRERGLDSYLVLSKANLGEQEPGAEAASATNEPGSVPFTNLTGILPKALSGVLQTYPELSGIALAADALVLAGSKDRPGWIAENFLLPLAESSERRTLFIGTDGDWWPAKDVFGSVESSIPVRMWAPAQNIEHTPERPPAASDFPVLWQVENGPEELLPWQDPIEIGRASCRERV